MELFHLTKLEAAHLAGVPVRAIDRSIEEGVIVGKFLPDSLGSAHSIHVSIGVVAYASAMKRLKALYFGIEAKKRLLHCIEGFGAELGECEPVPGLLLNVGILAMDEWDRARRYVNSRDAHLASREDIFGGEPIIAGTRITCRAVLGRINGGETLNEIHDEYASLPKAAIEAASIFASTHPPEEKEREGKPWRESI